MRILGLLILKDAASTYADAAKAVAVWRTKVEAARWTNLVELKADFASADYVDPFIVFNIRGNNYRLIAVVDFTEKIVHVRGFFTHSEYDKGNWK